MPVSWGLANGGQFQNALATGLQFGQMAGQRQNEREYRNALSAYDPANPETLKPIMAADPRMGMQLQQQQAQAASSQAAAAEKAQGKRNADLPVLTRLLDHAKDPASYQQALGLAKQYGIDVAGAPQEYDPAWIDQQKALVTAVQTPQGQEALSTAGKLAADMGFKPGTPEHAKVTREVFLADAAKPYTGSQGETRLYIPQLSGPNPAPPSPGTVVGGYTFKGGDPRDRSNWEEGGTGGNVGGGFQP